MGAWSSDIDPLRKELEQLQYLLYKVRVCGHSVIFTTPILATHEVLSHEFTTRHTPQ